ncbi:MAG: glycosyltransferase, partial [Deltaproteobacteria bacterium]|nr:glycosyltransferase [Deltaproteobacteria bacterium]
QMIWERLGRKLKLPSNILQANPLGQLWSKTLIHKLGVRKRREVVSGVMTPKGAVFGDDAWREMLGARIYRGRVSYGENLPRIYNGSAFVLDTRQPQSRSGLTQRIFDAGACGRPVLTEWFPELGAFFDPENELFPTATWKGRERSKNVALRNRSRRKKEGSACVKGC